MHLALWDIPSVQCLFAAADFHASSLPLEIERNDAETCVRLLLERQADVAFLPSTAVLATMEELVVMPGVAVSSWEYSWAWLLLRRGLEHVQSVAFASSQVQEALLARIILQEHYGKTPTFVLREEVSQGDDAQLVVGAEAPELAEGEMTLNLVQEWSELASYPMVWGLFVTRKDMASPAIVEVLQKITRHAEQLQEENPLHRGNLRFRLDDLAMASLTKLREYLYWYRVTREVPDLVVYEPPEAPKETWFDDYV